MDKGLIMQSGTPYDIYHQPHNKFVAEFIGDPPNNFFKGNLVKINGQLQLTQMELILSLKKKEKCP